MAGDDPYRPLAHLNATGGNGRIPVRRILGLMQSPYLLAITFGGQRVAI